MQFIVKIQKNLGVCIQLSKLQISNMISKNNQKLDSLSRKNIRVGDILVKSREKVSHKSIKKQKNQSIDYGTDSKKKSNSQSYFGDIDDMRVVIQSCQSCMEKISQFTTKKPKISSSNRVEDKNTQTINKPFLIDLIEERVNQICRHNRKLSKLLVQKQTQLGDRQSEIVQIEEKFTSILYNLGQELSFLRSISQDSEQIKKAANISTETPSYLKALLLQNQR